MGKAQPHSVVFICLLSIEKPRAVFIDIEMVCGGVGGDDAFILGFGSWLASAVGYCEATAIAGYCAWQHLRATYFADASCCGLVVHA